MNDSIESKVYRLSAITPVHISDGRGSENRGIVLMEIESVKYMIDSAKLFKEIAGKNDINKLESYVEMLAYEISNKRVPVLEDLKNKSGIELDTNIYRMMQKGIIISYHRNEFIRTGLNEPYIPGSSIKGAIRSAVLWKMIVRNKYNLNDYILKQTDDYKQEIQRIRKEGKRIPNSIKSKQGKKMTEEILQRYNLVNRRVKAPFRDLFKAVKISDSLPIIHNFHTGEKSNGYVYAVSSGNGEGVIKDKSGQFLYFRSKGIKQGDMVAYEISEDQYGWTAEKIEKSNDKAGVLFEDYYVSLYSYGSGNSLRRVENRQYECFVGSARITITLDRDMLRRFRGRYEIPFNSIDELISICEEYAQAQWQEEMQIYMRAFMNDNLARNRLGAIKRLYDKDAVPTLRLGWGTGMLGTTVALHMDMTQRRQIRNLYMKNRGNAIAPKSRRFISNNGRIAYPLGWVSLKEVVSE